MRTFVSNVYYIVGPPAVGKSYLMSQINYFLEKHKNSGFIRFINEDDAVLTYIGFKEGVAIESLHDVKMLKQEQWLDYVKEAYAEHVFGIAALAKENKDLIFIVSTGGLSPLRSLESYTNGRAFYLCPIDVEIYWRHFHRERLLTRGYGYLVKREEGVIKVIKIESHHYSLFTSFFALSDEMLSTLVALYPSMSERFEIKNFYFMQHRLIALKILKKVLTLNQQQKETRCI